MYVRDTNLRDNPAFVCLFNLFLIIVHAGYRAVKGLFGLLVVPGPDIDNEFVNTQSFCMGYNDVFIPLTGIVCLQYVPSELKLSSTQQHNDANTILRAKPRRGL